MSAPARVLPGRALFGTTTSSREFGPIAVCITDYPPRLHLEPHGHADPYLTLIGCGGYRERTASETRRCVAGALLVHAEGEVHEDVFLDAPTRCVNVFTDRAWRSSLPPGTLAEPRVVAPSSATLILRRRLEQEVQRADAASTLVVQGVVLELAAFLLRSCAEERATPWLQAARELIGRRFTEPLTLREVAAAVGVHSAHLARAFRQRFGTSVGEEIRRLRVDAVCQRLRSDAPLAQVAQDIGFADQSHMTRTFVRVMGITPAAYRRRSRGG